jgi:hypothetical protein
MHSQNTPLKYSPITGSLLTMSVTLTGADCRERYPHRLWAFNPWTGTRRLDSDIKSDPTGLLILPPGEELLAAATPRPKPLRDILEMPKMPDTFQGLASRFQAAGALHPALAEKAFTPASALGKQEGGDHYKKMKIQPIEYIHANGIPFAEGCAIKYLTRWRDKGGVEDLKKARHFIDLLIELETRK